MAGDELSGFHWLDYVLFTVMLLVSLGIGIYAAVSGGKQKTTREFLVGNRQLSVLPVTASIFMSFISAILVLGNTAEMYLHGGQIFLQVIGVSFAFFVSAIVVVPIMYPLNITSSFQYLTMRYNAKHPKVVGDFLLMISQVLYMGVAMFAPSTALEGATGFPDWASIIICGIVATIYTSIGGMKAVVWTDALQGIVFVAGIVTVLAIGTHKVGGLENVWQISKEKERLDIWNFNMNPFEDRITFWSCTIGMFFAGLGIASNQTSVQRISSVKSIRSAKLSMVLLAPIFILMYFLTCLMGLVVFVYYEQKGCDPLRAGYIISSNQLLPRFIMEEVNYPGLPGIFLSVLFAGALSSLSSSISALAAITWKDLIEPFFPDIAESRKAVATKVLSLVFGIAATAMAFAFKFVEGHVLQLALSLFIGSGGPILGMFLAGYFFPCVNAIGISISALLGLGVTMWLAVGQILEKPYVEYLTTNVTKCIVNTTSIKPMPTNPEDVFVLYKMSFLWFSCIGATSTVISSIIISAVTGPMKGKDVDPRLMAPLINYIAPCLPSSIKKKFWCSVRYDEAESFLEDTDAKLTAVNGVSSNELKDVLSTSEIGSKNPAYS